MAGAKVKTLPAPIGGWNARDALSSMKTGDAVVLDNMIPGNNGVDLRFGCDEHADGIGSRIGTLMQYSGSSGGNQLFAAAGQYIYDVTNQAPVDPADYVQSGLGNALFVHTMFGNAGGNYLVACNGTDPVRHFNGTAWAQPAITGVTSSDLSFVIGHAERLWFIEKQSTRAWYLGIDAITGPATKFDLGSMLNLGGSLVAMASWTRDGGAGSDDVMVFISSKGEVVLYSGTDPAQATTWQRVGVFKIAPPVGRNCVRKAGADLAVLTSQGAVALSSILPLSSSDTGRVAVTNKVEGAFNKAVLTAGALNGWQIVEYPRKQLLIVNVPQPDSVTFHQYVMNVAIGAWCRFLNWNATCWELLGDKLYFGTTDGRVMVLSDDYLDDGQPIIAEGLPAFTNFGAVQQKLFLQARPLFTAAQGTDPPIEMKVDYDLSPATMSQSVIPSGGSPWGSPWYSPWGPSIVSVFQWQSVGGYGQVGSPRIKVASQTPLTWHGTIIEYELAGVY